MIDEGILIEGLKKWIRSAPPIERDIIVDVIGFIEEQDKVGEWIPISEDVPHTCPGNALYDIVRVQFNDGTLGLGVYREGDDNRWWTRKDEGGVDYTPENCVVAWYPLLSPYEGNERENK